MNRAFTSTSRVSGGWPAGTPAKAVGVRHPILLAPMAGAGGVDLATAVGRAGGLAALPCGMSTPERIESEVAQFRSAADAPINLNFFCHALPEAPDDGAWRALLAPYYAELEVGPGDPPPLRRPFSAEWAELVERVRPEVVSFHFGLPAPDLLERVRATGAFVIGNATSLAEGRWLAERGVDAVIAQGWEAGGHSGYFLTDAPEQVGLFALVRLLSEALPVPVIAAGGIMDGRGIAAALTLGASAVQLGTAFLASPEGLIAPPYRAALASARAEHTMMTNLVSGRAARGIPNRLTTDLGAMNPAAPPYPYASAALAPLRKAAEAAGRDDFTPLWAGQGAPLARAEAATETVERLVRDALKELSR
ncbi:2-nitropropane dioxygenase [Sphingomonas sp. MAH-20]|uniref:Nitronate monooxygenase n=1 Tax=Sphingomonas horti TaxID=2682842 RepID=A0A6I4IYF8_9SPHN|nr:MULTISPECIES: nitronate monooxygenase [Sphingomonas]MBA2920947.1 nitronate monooxygenase [Sphingomonas sp. CGMCC 1.13658]MVO76933.1 2-nitropropane dioxygenase [Sphingomonas horti]